MDNSRQMRFTEDELRLIKATFKDNTPLLKLMAKVFCPPLDIYAPAGMLLDIYMSIQLDGRSDADVANNTRARNLLINHLNLHLQELEILANTPEETQSEKEARIKKNSNK